MGGISVTLETTGVPAELPTLSAATPKWTWATRFT
jgi:hypothetical protein